MSKRSWIVALAVFSVGGMLIQPAGGAEYPTRPIELMIGMAPGGTLDILCRLIADMAPKYLKEPMIVVNKPGAGGSIAAADIISSRPDGYKLLFQDNFFMPVTVKTQKVPFKQTDLIPIANFAEYKNGLAVRGDSPWKTLKDLLDYGKKNPGTMKWGHQGRGVAPHIQTLLTFRKAGVDAIDIPYRGSGEVLTALLGGHVDAGCLPYGTIIDHIKGGRVRYLVLSSSRRFADLPDVPSALELGFKEVAMLSVFAGVYAHKDIPEDVKKILLDTFQKMANTPELKKGILEKVGNEPKFEGPETMTESMKRIEEIAVPVLKELGIYVER
jgi:tripartite-type tricarboxylate transporter receptor subunit TctC